MILKPRISGDVPYKRKWEVIAVISSMLLGLLLFLPTLLIPNYSTEGIYAALPSFARGIFASINDVSIKNPYYPITIFFIVFIQFPSCLAWIFPSLLIGFNRNKQYKNVDVKNNGWKVFWHGTLFIELTGIIFVIGLVSTFLFQLIPGMISQDVYISFFGSGIFLLILFAVSPFFWLGLLLSGLGGYIGMKFAINKVATAEIVIEEVEAEEVFEEEDFGFGESIDEDEGMMWPEEAAPKTKADIDVEIQAVDISSLKEKIKSTTSKTATAGMITCKCGKELPVGARFCNNCGNKLN